MGEALRTVAERFGDPGHYLGRACRLDGGDVPVPRLPFASLQDIDTTVELWRELFPDSAERAVEEAEGILDGRIPVFSGTVNHGGPIDWHRGPDAGWRPPLKFYRDIDMLDPAGVKNIKYIWELNRCNFLVTLGQAYLATGERRFFDGWRGLVSSWINANPYNRGINWESSLELAIRAINWIWSGCLFAQELDGDPELTGRMLDTLCLHGRHIERHLSRWFSPNTHLTGEALGLLFLASAYPHTGSAGRWKHTAESILETELRRQILPDGGYFEMATWYHKYTIDFYLHYLILSDRPETETRSRVHAAVRHLAMLAGPGGTIPLLGDSDGGRLLALSPSKDSILGACCSAAVMLDNGELKALCGGTFDEETLWLLGREGLLRFRELREEEPRTWHSVNHDTGLFCFRTGMGKADSLVTVDCGPHGWSGCGHAHADMLSFVFSAGGGPVIVDPGTFTYSGSRKIRDSSRSSQSHNTITINDTSQSIPGETFGWRSIACPRGAFCRTDGVFGYFEGGHDGYDHFDCRHMRVVLFFGGGPTMIVDFVDAGLPITSLLYNLQFAEGRLEEIDRLSYRFTRDEREFFVLLGAPDGASPEIVQGYIYPDFHFSVPAPRLRLHERNVKGTRRIVTLLSEDGELVGRTSFDSEGYMRASSDRTSFELRTVAVPAHRDRADSGASEIEISVLVRDRGRTFAILRNSDCTPASDGAERFKARDRVPFLAARWEGGTLNVSVDGTLSPLCVPADIRTMIVNGAPVSFEQRDGWVHIVT